MGHKVIMNKTLNQRIYEVPLDVKKAIYDSGYKDGCEDGIERGKLCASQQILNDLEEFLTKRKDEYKQNAISHPEIDYPEANVFWTGRGVSCHELLQHIIGLKNKYGVQ